MRFLLNPTVKFTSKVVPKGEALRIPVPKESVGVVSPLVSFFDDSSSVTKSWGQQCSPTCGCIVRFEAIIDPSTQMILNAKYHAKSLVSIEKDGELHPVRTTRTNKPMMKECKCKTVHTLASDIVSYVTSRKVDTIRNMSEFSSTRSSPAFRHAVLVENKLPRTDTHCFDVLEEAYTALIKGYMLPSRRGRRRFDTLLAQDYLWTSPVSDEDEHLEPSRTRESMSQTPSLSMSSPRSVSTLTMFDINEECYENEEFQRQEQEEQLKRQSKSLDWLSFVDEQNKDHGTA